MRPCPCKWSQTRDSLVLTFTCKDAENGGLGGAPAKEVTDDAVSYLWGDFELAARFLHPVDAQSAQWEVRPSGVGVLIVRKALGHPKRWPQPFDTKIPHLKVDWDRYEDDDWDDDGDEDGPAQLPTVPPQATPPSEVDELAARTRTGARIDGAPSSPPGPDKWLEMPNPLEVPAQPDKDAAAPDGAPPLPVSTGAGGDEPKWVADWRGLTMPQRMVTMALCWNAQDQGARQESALRLVEILRGGGEQLAQLEGAIKGGHLGKLKLDTSVYDAECRPQHWVTQFAQMAVGEQMAVLAIMFQALEHEEQKLVVSTFG